MHFNGHIKLYKHTQKIKLKLKKNESLIAKECSDGPQIGEIAWKRGTMASCRLHKDRIYMEMTLTLNLQPQEATTQ